MESMASIATDRSAQLKAFDEAQTCVKGLFDSGITKIPAMFHAPLDSLKNSKPPLASQQTIPIIDLKGVYNKNQDSSITRQSVVEKIGDAAEKWGFFQVVNHGIPLELLERMIEGVRGFHEQDPELKKQFYSRELGNKKPVYHSNFDIHHSPTAHWADTLGCYMSPDPPRPEEMPTICREVMTEYSKEMTNLCELLFELLSEALGLNSNHLKDMDCAKSMFLAGQYYPPCPQPDLTLGLHTHTDFSFLTIVLQNNIGGLQVLHDQYWVDIPPVHGAIVVNAGDLLQLISNDRFISLEHRVLANEAGEPRISVPCFFNAVMNTNPRLYGPIKEILSEHNPPKYRDITTDEFKKVFRSEVLNPSTLRHFKI